MMGVFTILKCKNEVLEELKKAMLPQAPDISTANEASQILFRAKSCNVSSVFIFYCQFSAKVVPLNVLEI